MRSAVANCRRPGSVSANAEVVVRVNGVESGMLHQDLDALFSHQGSHDPGSSSHDHKGGSPDAIMLPKVESVEHLLEVSSGQHNSTACHYSPPSSDMVMVWLQI